MKDLAPILATEANFWKKTVLNGIDVRSKNISRTRLNMFLVGDGHTNMKATNTLDPDLHPFLVDKFDYIITNPPYGVGTVRADTSSISTVRTEIAFVCRIRQLLKIGGRACVIQPDGVLENPSFAKFRKELLETCDITAIVSLPKFAFAPYTKEKTYALFLTKRSDTDTKPQSNSIWMYIIDNDGLANSDKRFPTKLRNDGNKWMHDEISGWVSKTGDETKGALEQRWMNFDDSDSNGTEWMDEKGNNVTKRKAGWIGTDAVLADKHCMLLPEYYLRSSQMVQNDPVVEYDEYQAKDIHCKELFDVMGGNSGLTEEYLYSLLTYKGDKKYRLLTGSVDPDTGIVVHRCNDPKNPGRLIKVISEECVHIVRKGKAGHVNYLQAGDYTMTDDAYLLTKKLGNGYEISLEWLVLTHKGMFKEYASSSDNGTWNKGAFLNFAKIDIPLIESQLDVVERMRC